MAQWVKALATKPSGLGGRELALRWTAWQLLQGLNSHSRFGKVTLMYTPKRNENT